MKKTGLLAAIGVATALAAAPGHAGSGNTPCAPGTAVSILYGGQWYPGKVLKGPDRNGTCQVSYDGYGSNWDEWVNPNRLRPASGGSRAGQPAAAAATPAASGADSQAVPPGRYSCYTFDNGQLNYTFTDVVIEAGSRYSVGNKGGTYALAAGGAMDFTGPMANAAGKFAVKSGGKPQIDLVFNGDNRASMTCPKSR